MPEQDNNQEQEEKYEVSNRFIARVLVFVPVMLGVIVAGRESIQGALSLLIFGYLLWGFVEWVYRNE